MLNKHGSYNVNIESDKNFDHFYKMSPQLAIKKSANKTHPQHPVSDTPTTK